MWEKLALYRAMGSCKEAWLDHQHDDQEIRKVPVCDVDQSQVGASGQLGLSGQVAFGLK